MIRLKTLDENILIKLIAGVLTPPTTQETYLYLNELFSILPPTEVVKEFYCIFSAFESLYEIYSIRGSLPTLSKITVLEIIKNNLYGELKENHSVGFDEFAKINCNMSIDIFNEQSIATTYKSMIEQVDITLTAAVNLKFSIEDSQSSIPLFLENFSYCLANEMSSIIINLNNNDAPLIKYQFWGWSDFLYKFKIKSILNFSTLIGLVASHHDNKVYLSNKDTRPLTSLQQIIKLQQDYIESDIPLGYWEYDCLNDKLPLLPHQVTVIVGQRGVGKTTFGGCLAGNLIAQGKRVLFYCPEIMPSRLVYSFILPSYIYAKYKFLVTPEQCLGLELPYPSGGDLTVEQKSAFINLAKLEFSEKGLFYHSDNTYNFVSLEQDIKSKMMEFNPDFLIFDHTLEIKGENNYNVMTQHLASVFKELKKQFSTHIIALSHTGSEFKVPTKSSPIVTSKIVAWSNRIEGVADNIVGMFESLGCINLFFTKLRWSNLMPMYLVFRMDKKHGLFNFREVDQLNQGILSEDLEKMLSIVEGNFGINYDKEEDGGEEEEEYLCP